jgi:hypothetical protein
MNDYNVIRSQARSDYWFAGHIPDDHLEEIIKKKVKLTRIPGRKPTRTNTKPAKTKRKLDIS